MVQPMIVSVMGWWLLFGLAACSFVTVQPAPSAPAAARGGLALQPTAPPVVVAGDASAMRSTTGGLPVFPAALPLDASSALARLVSDVQQQASQQQPDLTLSVDSYALPATVPFAAVREFYHAELHAAGWQAASDQHDIRFPGMQASGFAAWVHTNRAFVTVTRLSNPTNSEEVVLIIQHGMPR